jgi:hypothetical protein
MNIQNLSELAKLIKIMRKTGVESLKSGDLDIKLRPDAPLTKRDIKLLGKDEIVPTNRYTDEDLLFWSSTPPGAVNG